MIRRMLELLRNWYKIATRDTCHIYDRHIPAVKAMLEREGYPAPTFKMDESITDFYAFTKDSFKMENYQFHPFDFEIPMAI